MGAQHGHGHGRERQGGAEARKRVWPGLFLRGVAIIVVLVVSVFVSVAFSPLVHDLYWPSYHHPPGAVQALFPLHTHHHPHHTSFISQSINQLSRSPVQLLVTRCSLQSWIHASSHLTWVPQAWARRDHAWPDRNLATGGSQDLHETMMASIHCNALPLTAPREKKKTLRSPRSGELGVLAEPRGRLPRTHLSTLRALHGRRHLGQLK